MNQALSTQEADRLFGTGVRDQALMLLGRGMTPGKVAMLLEVSPALISQYKAEPEFKSKLDEMLLERSLAAQLRDEKLDALEDSLIEKVEETLVFITKPMEAVKALQAINSMKRRTEQDVRTFDDSGKGTIVLELPEHMENSIVNLSVQFNTNKEIVEVGGRAMRTMQSTEVLDKLRMRQEEKLKEAVKELTTNGRVIEAGAGEVIKE